MSVLISFLFVSLSYFKTRRRRVLVNGHQIKSNNSLKYLKEDLTNRGNAK